MSELTYVFVTGKNDFDSVKSLIRDKRLPRKSVMVLLENSMEPYFKGHEIEYLLLSDYAKKTDFNPLKKNLLAFIETFPHEKIINNKSFVELLEYNGYSLWWFVRQGLYEHILRVMREIYIIRSLIKEEKIRRILLLTDNKEFISIARESVKNSKAGISFSASQKSWASYYPEIIRKLFFGSLPRVIRIFQGFFRSLKIEMQPGKKNVLLFTQDWTNLSESIRGDHNSYTILRDLLRKKEHNVLPLDVVIDKNAQWKSIREKKWPFVPYDYFIFKSYFDIGITKNIGFLRQRLRRAWSKLNENNKLRKILTYDGIDLGYILKPKISSYFFNRFDSFLSAARNIEVSKKLIDNHNIDATICIDENGHSRFLVFASHMCKIPSLGLQHGIIHPLHISYLYGKKDLYGYKNKLNCILADKTAVFGRVYRNLLVKNGNYSQSQIAVTGQPRTDIFIENKAKYSKRAMCKKLGIDYSKKLVVYASQPFEDMSEQRIALTEVVKALRSLKNAELVVKLHPTDDSSFYGNILSDLKYKAIATKEADLYTLLFCSDLVISICSTVMLEAVIMKKPVIQLNLMEDYDLFGGLRSRIFTKITRKRDLLATIKSSLFNKSFSQRQVKERRKFISEYYYKVDGKATERFINIMDGLLENKK